MYIQVSLLRKEFFSQKLTNLIMELSYIILFVVLGLLIIMVEMFIIPGTTVIGFAGFGICLTGITLAYANYDPWIGHVITAASITIGLGSFYLSIKFGLYKAFSLKTKRTA